MTLFVHFFEQSLLQSCPILVFTINANFVIARSEISFELLPRDFTILSKFQLLRDLLGLTV
jgi:hypothetical protein